MKIIKRVLISLMFIVVCLEAHSSYQRSLWLTMHIKPNYKKITSIVNNLNHLQKAKQEIMRLTYSVGAKYNLGYTLLAIVYKESHLGDYMFNSVTGDYGLAGINLKTFKQLHKITLDYWGNKKLASMLIIENRMNLAAAVNNLLAWRKVYKNNYRAIWGSYNGGWRTNYKYTSSILNTIIAFKIYFRNHPEIALYVKGGKQ